MCAIAGLIDFKRNLLNIGQNIYDDMLESMSKRGPNQNGKYLSEKAVLLHARLSVIDVENGKQPMSSTYNEDEYTIVYNGELYNTAELRKELIECGMKFNTKSDTEVLLKAYIVFGEKCLDKLNGIFAFAVWNDKKETLFIARDKIGVKPFFYAIVDGTFIFASEIKTMLKSRLIKAEMDKNSISEIMLIGPGRTSGNGVFKGVCELKPAECGYVSVDGIKLHSYWDLRDNYCNDSIDEIVEKVRFLVEDSITRQLVSDVPIGTFLSGGLDSSIISSIAARELAKKGEQLDCFSVYYKDNEKFFKTSKFQPNSDNEYIEIMKKYLNCNHHHIEIDTEQLADALYLAVDARDLPGMADVDSSLLLFCKEVKNYCTVALSGECADEIFGGYPWYRDKTIREAEGFPWAQSTVWRASFIRDDIDLGVDPQAYVFQKYKDTANASDVSCTETYSEKMSKIMVNLNMKWFMQTLLDRKDRMSMYSGLEVRVPFCDYRIASYLYTVPWEYKDYQGYEKGLLRKAVSDLLPKEVAWRKKSPYPKTHNPAYLSLVSERLQDIIANPNEPIFDIVDRGKLKTLLSSTNQIPWYGQLMTVPQTIAYFLQLNYWLKKYGVTIV